MMMVEPELRPSRIHGTGVFLLQPVREGELIWQFDSRIDRVYASAEIATLPASSQRFLKTYSTYNADLDLWVLCGDNGRHFNHSETPNTISSGIAFGQDHAAADLEIGIELTSDYRTICDSFRNVDSIF